MMAFRNFYSLFLGKLLYFSWCVLGKEQMHKLIRLAEIKKEQNVTVPQQFFLLQTCFPFRLVVGGGILRKRARGRQRLTFVASSILSSRFGKILIFSGVY